jgi:formylglycine-generating enzyme required for sulfatase activity
LIINSFQLTFITMNVYKWLLNAPKTTLQIISLLLPLMLLTSSCSTSQEFAEADETPEPEDFFEFTEEIPNSEYSVEMAPIPGDTFMMGPSGNQREVKVDPFWMSKHEITWNLFIEFAGESLDDLAQNLHNIFDSSDIDADIITFPSPAYGDMTMGMGFDGYPVISITQHSAIMFTKWLTVKTGNFYRLPTEAEWEYACRAGQNEEFSQPQDLDVYAWHRGNSDRSYHTVGSKEPNAYGLYDMLGNVAEWTLDQYHEDYLDRLEGEPAVNPWFKPTELYPRAVRGGAWTDSEEAASCLHRRGSTPNWKRDDPQLPKSLWWYTNAPFLGFRVVMPADQPETAEEMEEYWLEAIQDYF